MTAARGFDRLGWHWWPVDSAINSRAHAGRPACNHCGPCQQGCVTGAKASTDMTHWPEAIARGVEMRTGAVVLQVEIEAGRVTGVTYRTAEGDLFQPAETVVVAGNGVGTARLLLASGVTSPALGRNLMYHGAGYVRGFFADDLDGPVGPTGCSIYSHEFYETDRSRGFVRGVHLQATRENPLAVQAARLPRPWGEEAHAALLREFRHSMAILVVNEDLPEPENHVGLTGETAPDGLPGVRVVYRLSDHSRRALDFGLDRAEEMLRAAGAIETVRVPLAPFTGWHLLGTARMGTDPATSVTDASGRVHGVSGLLVADGSLFTTSAAVNPGSTIGALATKVADDFARQVA
jgi:choline dehydrogenase-like flavoprotein